MKLCLSHENSAQKIKELLSCLTVMKKQSDDGRIVKKISKTNRNWVDIP